MSTGYIQGSIPPRFSDDNRKPIELLGSDGCYPADGRFGLNRIIFEAEKRANNLKNIHSIVGFQIIQALSFPQNGRIIYEENYRNR